MFIRYALFVTLATAIAVAATPIPSEHDKGHSQGDLLGGLPIEDLLAGLPEGDLLGGVLGNDGLLGGLLGGDLLGDVLGGDLLGGLLGDDGLLGGLLGGDLDGLSGRDQVPSNLSVGGGTAGIDDLAGALSNGVNGR